MSAQDHRNSRTRQRTDNDESNSKESDYGPRFEQPISNTEVWELLLSASNSHRIMPIVKGNWEASTKSYSTKEDAGRALIFDFAFYTDYRNSQIQNLFNMTGMRGTFTDQEIDDIIEEAYFEQDGRSYPTFG